MNTLHNINDLRYAFRQYDGLRKIAKSLHTQDENACNYGLSARQEKRVGKLEEEAQTIAATLGLHAYHQGDPRGCSLYLVEDLEKAERGDTGNGIAII